jgi:predicted molibdopterin-dependent oxidoreductase YjgC
MLSIGGESGSGAHYGYPPPVREDPASMPKGRLTTPLIRSGGTLRPASWDEALDAVAEGFERARQTDTTESFGMFSCSKASNEMNFLAQKFARQVMGTNNIDSCNRT